MKEGENADKEEDVPNLVFEENDAMEFNAD
jgi:hypothetical protein